MKVRCSEGIDIRVTLMAKVYGNVLVSAYEFIVVASRAYRWRYDDGCAEFDLRFSWGQHGRSAAERGAAASRKGVGQGNRPGAAHRQVPRWASREKWGPHRL